MSPLLSTCGTPLNLAIGDNGWFEVKGVVPGNYMLMAMGTVARTTASGKRRITIEERDLNDVLITLGFARRPISGLVFAAGTDKTKLLVRLVPSTSADDEEN